MNNTVDDSSAPGTGTGTTGRGALRMLLLEDSAFDAELLQEALAALYPDAQLDLVHTEDGFLQALQRGGYRLILSDHQLPGFDGEQALELALAHAPEVPFIFVSGVIGEDNAVELLKRGATDYVSKGRLGRLAVVLERALREVEATQARRDAEERLRAALEAAESAQAAAEAAKAEAERSNLAKDRFLAILSHELRTPLAPVSLAARVLERALDVPEKYRDLLPMIQRNVALEARLIDDLLDHTSIASGKLGLNFQRVDLQALIPDVLSMVDEPVRKQGLSIELQLQPEPVLVRADPARLQQVVSNLVRNAVKFSGPGGRIVLRTEVDGDSVTLTCRDEGIGIEPEALGRIFTPFEQADGEVARRLGGLGLGLAIARHLVTEHGGEMAAASAGRDRGATFTVTLPRISLEERPALAPPAESALPAAPAAPGTDAPCRLLLVEDNPDAAEILAICLQEYGYQAELAASCADALALARAKPFDVVLTDLGLPDGSGVDIGRTLSPQLPVVALSGYGAAADLRRTQAAGFAGHLVKPAEPEEVHTALQQALARYRPAAGGGAAQQQQQQQQRA